MAIDINIPIEDAVTDGSLNPVTSNAVFDALALKANSADLGATAFSNDYNDLDNLPTIPSVTGFVPYTGATNDVDLGVHDLTATQGTFATSGNPDTLTVNHSSGSGKALTITKGGNGEGVYVNKTSGSGNAVTIIGDLEATNLKRTGGTSSQFLKANGSIDSTSYQPTLVSGTNIKTINGNSLLGSGDITISGGGSLTVGTTAIASGTVGRILFEGTGNVLQQDSTLFWDNANKRLGIGATPASTVRLDVRAQGALSTDIIQRWRNSADSANIGIITGDGAFTLGTYTNPSTQLTINSSLNFGLYVAGVTGIYAQNQSGSGSRYGIQALGRSAVVGATTYGIKTGADSSVASTTNYGIQAYAYNGTTNYAGYFDATGGTTNYALYIQRGDILLGNATTNKIGFWNKTPIVQPTTAITAATFVTNTSGILNDSATFDGYTIGQVVKALRNVGILA
jgi:hypothetical protein